VFFNTTNQSLTSGHQILTHHVCCFAYHQFSNLAELWHGLCYITVIAYFKAVSCIWGDIFRTKSLLTICQVDVMLGAKGPGYLIADRWLLHAGFPVWKMYLRDFLEK